MFKIIYSIRMRYRLALIAIALMVSCSGMLVQYLLSMQKTDSNIINIAGQQRMLSQKIALEALTLANTAKNSLASEHFETQKKQLQSSLTAFVENHQLLTEKNDQGRYHYLTPELEALYFYPPIDLERRVWDFRQQVEGILSHNVVAFTGVYQIDSTQLAFLLQQLNQAVSLFEQAAVDKVNLISRIEVLFWSITLVLLLVELKFIFQPMEKLVFESIQKVELQKSQLKLSYQLKERFIARASHEFRTPLQVVMAAIDDSLAKESGNDTLLQAKESTLKIVSLVDDLTQLQSLQSGQWQLSAEVGNLKQTLIKAIEPFEAQCEELQLRSHVSVAPELDVKVYCDHQALCQIMIELLTNAIKFTVEGSISVTAHWQSSNEPILRVMISDSGRGFSDGFPYLIEDNHVNNTTHFQGMQTGLARVQYILAQMSGTILLVDNSLDGATLQIAVPMTLVAPFQIPKKIRSCLIVEDNPLNALVLSQSLHKLALQSHIAPHGQAALELLKDTSFDLIFMDLNMPVLDGFDAMTQIRTTLKLMTPIIVITANTAQSDIHRAYRCGANYHLHKPFDLATLEALISSLK